jgi:ABC-type uncharacterized transport system involved in gliding motility auxiliary subunit
MTKKQTTIITALSLAAFVLALFLTHRFWFRLDLTKNKAYTISKVSRNLHTEIPDHVNITYYISDKLKTVIPSPGEIEDTLREYAAYSNGKIRVTVRDPIKGELAATVEELGLQPKEVRTEEQNQASVVIVYSGIVIEYQEKKEVLPWVISIDTLEYDLTSRIRSMVTDTERRIGVIIGDSFRQWREDFGYFGKMLADANYRVNLMSPGEEIPDGLPALFVLGGVEDMDEWALYRIDRYIQQGGKVLFAVKGIYVDTVNGTIEARRQNDRGLLEMIASYGVIVRPELALDRGNLLLPFETMTPNGFRMTQYVRYPFWIGVSADNGNFEHPVSSGFSGLDLYWPSPLELHPTEKVQAVPLFASSSQAWIMRDEFYTNPQYPNIFERDAAETRGVKILGAALTGQFPSFFGGYAKPIKEGSREQLPDMPLLASPSRIIVIGDTDFTTNIIRITSAAHNLDFLLRAADWLANDDDIIGIRSRQPYIGRFDRIADTQARNAAMRFSKIVNVGLIPLFVIAMGFFLAYRRRQRMRNLGS